MGRKINISAKKINEENHSNANFYSSKLHFWKNFYLLQQKDILDITKKLFLLYFLLTIPKKIILRYQMECYATPSRGK